jgi:hypothetical protein
MPVLVGGGGLSVDADEQAAGKKGFRAPTSRSCFVSGQVCSVKRARDSRRARITSAGNHLTRKPRERQERRISLVSG